MKKVLITSLCTLIIYASAFAQTLKERIEIKGGDDAWTNFMKEVYLYPSFKDGVVKYNDGQTFKKLLNYNKVLGTMEFIEKTDTMVLANEQNVNIIIIGVDVFLFNPECLQVIPTVGKVKLLKHVKVRFSDKQNIGAFGTRSVVGSIETYSQHETWRGTYDFNPNEIIILGRTTNFNIASDNIKITPATKKNILNLWSKHASEVRNFMQEHRTSFTNEKDLIELTAYLSQLDKG